MRYFILLFLFSIIGLTSFTVKAQDTILEHYIQVGLKSNLEIQQQHLSLDNALLALKQANRLYLPNLSFQALYTTAEGGRNYEVPVGDMMNPVYSILNQFMAQDVFPMLANQEINFLPHNYYDAKFRLTVPLLNMNIIHNQQIKEKQFLIKENELMIYKRELVKEIKIAYYRYLAAVMSIDIYQNAVDLALKSKRKNQKLLEAGKGLYAYVLRSETEVEKALAKKNTATYSATTLQAYFNALLNRDKNHPILIDTTKKGNRIQIMEMDTAQTHQREETEMLAAYKNIKEDVVKMRKHVFIPTLSAFADVGAQAEEMRIDEESLYYMIGLKLSFPIFSGFRNRLKIQAAKNELKKIEYQQKYVQQKINVAIIKAENEVRMANEKYKAALKQVKMAETYYKLIQKGYDAGINTYLETIDARTQLSSARIAVILNYYNFLIAYAELERASATYPLITNSSQTN